MNDFYGKVARTLSGRGNRNTFAQLVAEHGVRVCQLLQHELNEDKRGLMKTWAEISKLNDEWAGLVTRNERDQGSEFCQVTNRMIHLFSECLGDVILDRKIPKKRIEEVVNTESRFFEIIGGSSEGKEKWIAYTGSVLEMLETALKYGHESEAYHVTGSTVIQRGQQLGAHLDRSMRSQSK
jgi:hypothetical protein